VTTAELDLRRPALPRWSWGWATAGSTAAVGVGAAAGHGPLLGLAVLIVLVVTYAVIIRPFLGVVILVAFAPVTAGIKRGLVVPHLRPNEVLIVWLVPLILIAVRRPVRGWGTLEWLGLAYATGTMLLGAFDLSHRGAPFDTSNVSGLLGPFEYLLLLRAVRVGVSTDRERYIVVRTLLLAAVPICLFALAQGTGVTWAQHLRDTLTGVNPGHLDRATGTFTNWQVLAGYLLSIGLIAVAVAAFRAERIFSVRVATVLAVLIAAGLARTLTIGAFAGWIVGSGALIVIGMGIKVSPRRFAGLIGVAVLLLALVLAARYKQEFVTRPGQTSNGLIPNTVMDRINNWTQQYLPALSGRWVTGYGPNIPPNVSWKYTDSVYVTIILRGGLILLGIYVALMAGFLSAGVAARRALGASPEARAIAATLAVLVLILIPLQTIATYFTTSGLPEVIWILAALVSTMLLGRRVPA
jgi:hypothetical protein